MSTVGELINRETKAPYVKFERRAIEDVAESKKQGRYVAKDVDFAIVTSPYSKDNVIYKVSQWFENVQQQVNNNRTPQAWLNQWKAAYAAWKDGQELPLVGTPIKGWGIISPAQQETLIRMHVLTVEDLAATNDEGLRRIGMGAIDLRNKAKAWLAQLKDNGVVVHEIASLKMENERLSLDNKVLRERMDLMSAQLERMATQSEPTFVQATPISSAIAASDILDDMPTVAPETPETKRRGRPPKQNDEVI